MKTEEKLTAVEWMMREFQEVGYISSATYQQAKEMEKEQIDNAWDRGYKQGYYDPEFEKENIED